MKAAVMEGVRKAAGCQGHARSAVSSQWRDHQPPRQGRLPLRLASWSGDWTWVGPCAVACRSIMGHEFCGVVEEIGKEVKNFKKGDRVLVPFSQGDGTCEYCRSGNSNVCNNAARSPASLYPGGYGRTGRHPVADLNLVHMPDECRLSRRRLDGMPLHDLVPRHRRSRAGAARRMGRGHGCGGIGLAAIQIAVLDRRQRHRGRSRRTQARTGQGGRREPRRQRQEDRRSGAGDRRYHQGRRARLGRRARHRGHLPQLDHEPAQAGASSPDRSDHPAEKGEISVPIDRSC